MRGVTLLELIFVLVIIGVLTGVGFYAFRPNYLRDDSSYVLMRLKEIKYKAIGYDRHIGTLGEINASIGCFSLDDLNKTNSSKGNPYKFHSTLTWGDGSTVGTYCFDELGRLHQESYDGDLSKEINITIRYRSRERNISIDPWSGYGRLL